VPNLQGFRATLPLDGAVSLYAYTLDTNADEPHDVQARMFTPRMTEDPATGSATAAATALLALHRNKTTLNLTSVRALIWDEQACCSRDTMPRRERRWFALAEIA
jgi:predicted PhzF superfamily epimerase YddE/YHI9